jgi:NAD(P)-dependent dehydrogenase (short-subunit alcohol dehydrogenase family)
MTKFGSIDIVLPNAGVSEIGRFDQRMEEDGIQDRPTKPNLKTLEIDLIAVMYTTRIALWYFANDQRDADKQGLRAIAFTGSMSTFYGATMGVQYGAAKA